MCVFGGEGGGKYDLRGGKGGRGEIIDYPVTFLSLKLKQRHSSSNNHPISKNIVFSNDAQRRSFPKCGLPSPLCILKIVQIFRELRVTKVDLPLYLIFGNLL